jgi:hypothetical protein
MTFFLDVVPASAVAHSVLPALLIVPLCLLRSRIVAAATALGLGFHLMMDTPLGISGLYEHTPLWMNSVVALGIGAVLLSGVDPSAVKTSEKVSRSAGLLALLAPFGPFPVATLLLIGSYLLLRDIIRRPLFLLLLIGLVVFSFAPGLIGFLAHVAVVAVLVWIIVRRWNYFREHSAIVWVGLAAYSLAFLAAVAAVRVWLLWPEYVASGGGIAPSGAIVVLLTCGGVGLVGVEWVCSLALRKMEARGHGPALVVHVATTLPLLGILLVLATVNVITSIVGFFDSVGVPIDPVPPDPAFDPVAPEPAFDPVAPEPAFNTVAPDAPPAEVGVPEAPGTVRIAPYERTIPDGVLENNLSYQGPRPPGTPDVPGTEVVSGHVRTLPDGIVENNLSYRGEAVGTPPAEVGVPEAPVLEGSGTHGGPDEGAQGALVAAVLGRTCRCGAGPDQRVRARTRPGWFCLACGASEEP